MLEIHPWVYYVRFADRFHDQLAQKFADMTNSVDRSQIFKICSRAEWEQARELGIYKGAPIDLKDGFIHFSAKHQVKETAAKHFAGLDGLLLIRFNVKKFGSDLKWEASRGGDEFPHLYAELPTDSAVQIDELPLCDGVHVFPDDFSS